MSWGRGYRKLLGLQQEQSGFLGGSKKIAARKNAEEVKKHRKKSRVRAPGVGVIGGKEKSFRLSRSIAKGAYPDLGPRQSILAVKFEVSWGGALKKEESIGLL